MLGCLGAFKRDNTTEPSEISMNGKRIPVVRLGQGGFYSYSGDYRRWRYHAIDIQLAEQSRGSSADLVGDLTYCRFSIAELIAVVPRHSEMTGQGVDETFCDSFP